MATTNDNLRPDDFLETSALLHIPFVTDKSIDNKSSALQCANLCYVDLLVTLRSIQILSPDHPLLCNNIHRKRPYMLGVLHISLVLVLGYIIRYSIRKPGRAYATAPKFLIRIINGLTINLTLLIIFLNYIPKF